MYQLPRRVFLQGALAAAGFTWLSTGCAPYARAGLGPAFIPWDFPDGETRPEYLAVRAAILAANPHNTQPWLFKISETAIELYVDETRSLGAMDSLGRERYLGVGCALENAVLTARANGRAVAVEYLPDAADPTFAARLTLTPAPAQSSALAAVIPARRMNKFAFAEVPVPAASLERLTALLDDPRVRLRIVTDPSQRALLRQQSIDAVVAITRDVEMATASNAWWRQTQAEIDAHRDGLNLDIMGLDTTTRALAGTQSVVPLDQANAYWIDATRTRATTGAGFFVISCADRHSREQQLLCGRFFQRVHLALTSLGIDAHTINMLPEMQDREEPTNAGTRPFSEACASWVAAGDGFQMLTRFGYAFDRAYHTPRRPIDEVLR
jgi:hypothetical protein